MGLALSGGGAKGLAHIGVLKVLEELGVPVDYVAGTSMGAIIGGLYAAGYSPDSLSELVKQVDWQFAFEEQPARRLLRYDQKDEALKHLLEIGIASDQVFLPKGVVSGYKLTSLLTGLCLHVADIENFDHLPVPYRAVATDILNGDKVILDHGDLAKAMRASMSIPSVFPPYELHGRLLVDGGVVENMPVETVKAMGADIVIAVNVTAPLRTREQLNDLIDVMDQTIGLQMVKSTNISLGLADFVITPKVSDFGTFAFEQADTIIKLGEDAAREGQAGLIALLKALGEPLGGEDYPHTRPVKNILVSKVTLDGPQSYLPQLKLAAPFKPGEKISPEDLDLAVQKLYGLGDFESVSYRIVDSGEGRHEVCFTIKEKPGKVLTSVGLRVGFNSERVSRSQLDIRIRRPNTIFAGSYGWLDITLGRDLGAALGLNISNRPLAGLFLRPKIFINSYLHDVFYEQNMLAEFAVNSFGASIDTGFYLKTFGEITLGYIIKDDTLHNRIITVPVDEESHRLAGATASLKLDTLDRSPYPTKGLASVIKAVKMDKQLLSEENYTRLNWDGSVVAPLAARHTVEGNWSLGTSLNTDPPPVPDHVPGRISGHAGVRVRRVHGQRSGPFSIAVSLQAV